MLGLDHDPHAAAISTFRLPHPPHLAQTVAHARMGAGDPCMRLAADGSVWRATRTPNGPATQHISLVADGAVQVEAWGPGAGWLVARAPELCGAADAPDAFAPDLPLLQLLARAHPGLRIGKSSAVFETAMFATLEQRVATREAWQSWRLLVRTLGEPAPAPTRPAGSFNWTVDSAHRAPWDSLFVPPSPERIARLPYDVFHRFGVERRRAEILRRLAVVAHRLEELCELPIENAYDRLRSIAGIGPWTAARIAMIALGDADAVPLGDLHIPHLVTWRLAGERRGSDARMLELLEPYVGHRARVIRLLMHSAR